MGYIVYIRIKGSGKSAHQYVSCQGVRIGEIWREQVDVVDPKGRRFRRWRWFATTLLHVADGHLDLKGPQTVSTGFGTKDAAVDALEVHFFQATGCQQLIQPTAQGARTCFVKINFS